jgi:hypothetical protein
VNCKWSGTAECRRATGCGARHGVGTQRALWRPEERGTWREVQQRGSVKQPRHSRVWKQGNVARVKQRERVRSKSNSNVERIHAHQKMCNENGANEGRPDITRDSNVSGDVPYWMKQPCWSQQQKGFGLNLGSRAVAPSAFVCRRSIGFQLQATLLAAA